MQRHNKFIILLIMLLFLSSSAFGSLNSSLLSYWDGTISGSLILDSKRVNNLTNSDISNIAGKLGNGLNYDGADYAYKTIQPTSTTFSLCMWAKSDVAQTSGDYNVLYRWGTADGSPPEIIRVYWSGYTGADVLRLSTYNAAGTIANCEYTKSINTNPHFYCFVVNDSDKATYYFLNGTKQGECSTAGGASIDTSSQNFVPGSRYPGGDENWDGWIDEIGIYMNTALTQEQINALYNSTYGCNPLNNADCTEAPAPAAAVNMTPNIPTALRAIKVLQHNVTFNASFSCHEKCLLYQNGSNVVNFTTFPYTRTGLTAGTKYKFNVTRYNSSYSTEISNSSNTLYNTTLDLSLNVNQPTYPGTIINISIGEVFNLTFNGSVTGTSMNLTYNCSLVVYNSIPPFNPAIVYNSTIVQNITKTSKFQLGFLSGIDGATAIIDLYCYNNQNINATKRFYLWIDTTAPRITPINFENNTIFYKGLLDNKKATVGNTTLNLTFRGYDTHLYKVLYSVKRYNTSISAWEYIKDQSPYIREYNYSAFPGSPDNETLSYYSTTFFDKYLTGRYKLDIFMADGHTALAIDDYEIADIQTLDAVGVKVEDAIELTSKDVSDITLIKDTDRYSFDIVLEEPKEQITFNLKSDGKLDYMGENDEYLCWFVDWKNKKWIDFNSDSSVGCSPQKITDYEYNVVVDIKPVEIIKEEEIEPILFKSIGDLNEVNHTYYFNYSNSLKVVAIDYITNTSLTNFTIILRNSTGYALGNETTYNGAAYFNITGTYNLNFSSPTYVDNSTRALNIFFNTTVGQNHTFYVAHGNSLYLLIFDEQANKYILGRNVTISVVNFDNISTDFLTDTGVLFKYGFAAGDYEITYKASNYTPRSYYTTIVGSDTQIIYLYLLNDSNIDATHQYLNYNIVDESASPINNATLYMQRYYYTSGSAGEWKTVEMSKSNDQGEGFLFAELYDVPYRFMIDYEGVTKKITAQSKLDTRELLFGINLLEIGLDHYWLKGDVATSLVFSNTTKLWTYNYNAVGVNDFERARFEVTKKTPLATTTICNTTSTATSGGLTCNLTAYATDTSTFLGQGFIKFTGNYTEYLVEGGSYSFNLDYLKFGMTGVYLSFVAVGTITFIGLFSPVVAIVFAIFGLIISWSMGLIYLNYSWMVGLGIVGLIYIYSVRQP